MGVLLPFAEIVKLDGVRRLDARSLAERVVSLTRMPLIAAPSANPTARFADGLAADLELRVGDHVRRARATTDLMRTPFRKPARRAARPDSSR